MKKLVLTTLAVSALTVSTFAQGTVSWGAPGASLIVQTNGTTYSSFSAVNGNTSTGGGTTANTLGNNTANNTALGYNGYYYELLVNSSGSASAPTTFSQLSGWSDANLQATNASSNNGRVTTTATGGAGGVPANTAATASNWAATTTESFIIVGWSANLGSTWSTALANAQSQPFLLGLGNAYGYWGVSAVGSLASASGNPGPTIFGSNPGQLNNPSGTPMVLEPLAATPEPTTMALAAIGGASLLLFRRKK